MDSSRMRIALVSSSYHPYFGGVEEHVRHVGRELLARGHAVEVWTVDRGDGLRDEVVDGCRVRYLPTPLPARSVRALGSLAVQAPQALARWVGAFASFRPDVINVQCFGPNGIYGLALAKVTRTPLVVSSHGETFGDEHGVFDQSALLRASLRRAAQTSTTTACSMMVADDLRLRFGAGQVHVIPNGVDIHLQASPESRPIPQATAPVLLGVGRLVPQKGFDILLEAAARSHHRPEVWIVGDGGERRGLEDLAASLGTSDRVRFLGRRSPEDVRKIMASAAVVVVPSRAEAFGIVVLEAWAAGTPVIATARGGPREIITHGRDGLLIDPADLPSLIQGIDLILHDAEVAKMLARQGLVSVQSYSWQEVTDQYGYLFSHLVNSTS